MKAIRRFVEKTPLALSNITAGLWEFLILWPSKFTNDLIALLSSCNWSLLTKQKLVRVNSLSRLACREETGHPNTRVV